MSRYLPAPPGAQPPDPAALRRVALAVAVLHDVDLVPSAGGLRLLPDPDLPGSAQVEVSWDECAAAVGGAGVEAPPARERLARWLRTRRRAGDLTSDDLHERLRPLGLPAGHVLHPGAAWVRERVLGGALELGLGAVGLDPSRPDEVVPLPVPALLAAGIDPDGAWDAQRARLEALGAVAVDLLAGDPDGRLRPIGDADVVTLLGAAGLRRALADGQGGLCSAVVPVRRRGWTRLALVDPAFGAAAAAATQPEERGFARALLITADEVVEVPDGGSAAELALRQAAADGPACDRAVLRR